jgi:CheY-like chemotaxis protein
LAEILICAPDPLSDDLHGTAIWRDGNQRHLAASFEEALVMAVAVKPDLLVIDRDLPRAERLIEDLRKDESTRHLSIVVAARGEMSSSELHLLEAGVNAVMRIPAGPEWDERLSRLMRVPPRRAARVPLRIQFQGRTSRIETVWGSVLNLSATGMLIEAEGGLEVGADLDFKFQLPGEKDSIRGAGQIVRTATQHQFGVRFYGLEGDGAQRVSAFVAKDASAARSR